MDAYFKIRKKYYLQFRLITLKKSLVLLMYSPKSFSCLVSLNKYHYLSGLVDVLDMITVLFGRNKKVS